MSGLTILLAGGRLAYAPGETMRGAVAWSDAAASRRLELRLLWRVTHAGGEDAGTADVSVIDGETAAGERPFTLRLPLAPFSYRGASWRLDWHLELINIAARVAARVDLVIAPGGEPVTVVR